LGDGVTVEGRLRNNTICVASFKLLTAIGLNVGRKAPPLRPAINLAVNRTFQKAQLFSSFVQPTDDRAVKGIWSSCKTQKRDLRDRDLKVAAISYDSEEILK